MAEDTLNNETTDVRQAPEADVSTLDALHLDGKGTDRLDDAEAQDLPDAVSTEKEDVKGFANVQSAGRETFEKMMAHAPAERGAAPVGDRVVPEPYVPSEPDNQVDARFENPFPASAAVAAETVEEHRPEHVAQFIRPEEPVADERPVADAPEEEGDEPGQAAVAADDAPFVPLPETIETEDTDPELIQPVAQVPTLTVTAASGVENQLTKLSIAAHTNDSDGGSESIGQISIAGLPDYFDVVDANGLVVGTRNGDTWTFFNPTASDLDDLYLKNRADDDDADFSGNFTLTVSVTATDGGSTATTSSPLDVHIEAVADTPGAQVADSAGMENTWIDLSIQVVDKDVRYENGIDVDQSETQTVYIHGVPDGGQLNHGTYSAQAQTLEDGTVIPAGSWVVSAADLGDLKVMPPANDSHDFHLTVWAASTEAMNGDTAVTGPMTIEVDVGVVAPSASGSGTGLEDGWAALSLSASVNLADNSETLSVFLTDLPLGVELAYSDGSSVPVGGDGRYEITGRLDDLKVRWTTAHLDDDITFNLVAEVVDGDIDADTASVRAAAPDFNSVVVPVTVTVQAVADAPTLAASAVGVEDQWFDFDITSSLVDQDGSEVLTVTVSGPAGFTLNHGTETAPGVWSLSQSDLSGLQIKAAQDSDADFDVTVTATATEQATGDQVAVKTAQTSQTVTVRVLSDADTPWVVVDEPAKHVDEDTFYNLRTAISGGYATTGGLGELGAGEGEGASPDTSESLTFRITPVESGLRLTVDGVLVDLPDSGYWTVTAQQVFGGHVAVGGAADWSGTGEIHFDVTPVSTEAAGAADDVLEAQLEAGGAVLDRSGVALGTPDRLTLVVDPVADSITLVDANSGVEDQVGGITVDPVLTFSDTDMSERPVGMVTFTSSDPDMISGVLKLNGTEVTAHDNGDGTTSWQVPASAFVQSGNTWTLSGLKFFPQTHLAEDAAYTVRVDTQDVAGGTVTTVTAQGSISVEAVADAPDLAVQHAAGMENTAIALSIDAALVDQDLSETMTVYIADLPSGAVLNHGTYLSQALTLEDGTVIPAGSWAVAQQDLDTLTMTPPADYSDDLALRVWAATVEARNGDTAVTGPKTLLVDIGIVDPSVNGNDVTGDENTWTKLDVSASVNAADGSETLRVFLEDVPEGLQIATSSNGSGIVATPVTYVGSDGSTHTGYEVTGNLSNLYVRWSGANSDADFDLTVRAIAYDRDADAAADVGGFDRATAITDTVAPDSSDAVDTMHVTIRAQADGPNISMTKGVGVEDQYAVLKLSSSLKDTDGSETLWDYTYVKLPDSPAGMILQSGDGSVTYTVMDSDDTLPDGQTIPAGYYKLTNAQAADLRITNLAAESDSDFKVTVKAVSIENGTDGQVLSSVKVSTSTPTVVIFGDADKPTVAVDDDVQTVDEDAFFNLRGPVSGYDPLTGGSGEAGSTEGAASSDGSETITYTVTAKEAGSRLWIDADGDKIQDAGEVTTLVKDQATAIDSAQLYAGNVYVGGAANWGSNGSDLHFDFQTTARESDAGANTSSLSGTGLSRQGSAVSDVDTLTLHVEAQADGVTIGTQGSGLEDTIVDFLPTITLKDTDGSEQLVGTVDIVIAQSDLHGTLLHNGVEMTKVDDGAGNWVFSVPVSDLQSVGGSTSQFRLTTVQFQPDEHSAADLVYRVRAVTKDSNGDELSVTSTPATMKILAVADAPEVGAGDGVLVTGTGDSSIHGTVTGTEDTRIAVDLTARLVDQDTSESLSKAELWSVDDGWTVGYLSGGVYVDAQSMGGGKWSLDVTKLDQVVLNPPANLHVDAGSVTMEFHAWSREGEANNQVSVREAESAVTFQVVVNADADAPTLLASHARTDEDTPVKLDIRGKLADTDGSETLTYLISGVPAGASFQTGTGAAVGVEGPAGTWTFSATQVSDLYFVPKHDSNLDPTLTVTARATEGSNGDVADTSVDIKVIVRGISDGADIPAANQDANGDLVAFGEEDKNAEGGASTGAVIDPGFGAYGTLDEDGSETLSVVVSNLPDGVDIEMTSGNEAYLKYIGGGKWSVDPDHLGDVRLHVAKDYAGSFDVSVALITTEDDGHSLAVNKTLHVTVDADADKPSVSVGASVTEDDWSAGNGVPITVSAAPVDVTAGIETITEVTIDVDVSGLSLPGGTVLELHLGNEVYVVGSGVEITLSGADLASYLVNGKVQGLTLHGLPEDWSTDIPVTVTATATDVDGSTATRQVTGKVSISPDADAPTLTVNDADAVTGTGQPVVLDISAQLNDADLSESMYFVVSGVPNGVELSYGYNNGDGTWTVPFDPGHWPVSAVSDYTGTARLTFHPVVIDHDPDGGTDTLYGETVYVDLTVDQSNGAGSGPWTTDPVGLPAPTLGGAVSPQEDVAFDLDGLTLTAGAGTSISALVVTGVPAGASVAGGYYNHVSGTWTVPADSLDSLSITPPDDFSGDMTVSVRLVAQADSGTAHVVGDATTLVVPVAPVTDGATFTLSANGGGAIIEDMGDIPLSILMRQADSDFSESMTDGVLTIRLVSGAGDLVDADGNVMTASGGVYTVSVADFGADGQSVLSGLKFRPPADYSGSVELSFSIGVQDGSASAKTSTGTLRFTVAAEADIPTVHAADVSGAEDQVIALDVKLDGNDLVGAGAYGSESISVIVGGVPAGAVIQGAFNNNDGTWTVKGANVQLVDDPALGWVAKLVGVGFLPAQDDSTDWDLTITAFVTENGVKNEIASASGSFHVTVAGVADKPTIDPQDASGNEDLEVALNLQAQLVDLSESLTVTISGVPDGVRFTDGAGNAVGSDQGGGVWVLSQSELGALHFQGPLHEAGAWTMTATAISTDEASTAASNTMSFTITLSGVADAPQVVVGDLTGTQDAYHAAGAEDQAISLSLSAALVDPVGETLSVTIDGAPAGSWFLTTGGQQIFANTDGKWYVESDDLAGLKLRAPDDWNGDIVLQVTAVSSEGATTATTTETLLVHVEAVNDAPDISLVTTGQSQPDGSTDQPIHVVPGPDSIVVTDVDGSMLSGMTVSIEDGAQMGDALALSGLDLALDGTGGLVVFGTGISVSYDGTDHTLTFTGSGTYAEYAEIAGSVILSNTSGVLEAGTRQFQVTVFDEDGAAGTVQTNAQIGTDGSGDALTLTGDALGEVRWSDDGSVGLGDDIMVVHSGDPVSYIDGGLGADSLLLQHGDGSAGDWLFMVDQQDGSITATSAGDKDFIVHVDNGATAQVDGNGDLVFNGDASGNITFDDGSTIHFAHIERLMG